MTTFRAVAAVAALLIASVSVALPAGPKSTVKAPKVSTRAPKANTQAPKANTHAPKAATKTAKADGAAKSAKAKSTSTSTTPTPTATPTADPAPVERNAISTKISGKPEQLARIQPMLPPGMTLEQATAGFRNQGQFMAALNASKNRNINFVDLQKAMTVDGLSLGQAVKKLTTPPPTPPTPPPGDSL